MQDQPGIEKAIKMEHEVAQSQCRTSSQLAGY